MAILAPLIKLTAVNLILPSLAGPIHILKDITVSIEAGETVAILGPSGSGKSSLMALMAGLERATSGTVEIDGVDFTPLSEDSLAVARRGKIGIVLQAFHLIPTMTARENVAMPLELMDTPTPFVRAEAMLAQVGLSHRPNHYPAQLSGGEQQRVAIARAMAPQPKLLFADEPTGNLDAATGQGVIDLLFSFQKNHHTTMVIITHDDSLARQCTRIIRVIDGRIVEEQP